jgi:callose synthase
MPSLDEWANFLERIGVGPDDGEALKGYMDDIRLWASYRGQTLARTGNMIVLLYWATKIVLLCLFYSSISIIFSAWNDVL